MIDPALLRPGRLDKSILCDMPTPDERFDIIKCVTSTMNLSESLDLRKLADETKGYTGADLSSLFANAQLAAIHESITAEPKVKNTAGRIPLSVIKGNPPKKELDAISLRVDRLNRRFQRSLAARKKLLVSMRKWSF
jgi:SpoVK/Ycf46/Vps4 family AAA+-type ATPase